MSIDVYIEFTLMESMNKSSSAFWTDMEIYCLSRHDLYTQTNLVHDNSADMYTSCHLIVRENYSTE